MTEKRLFIENANKYRALKMSENENYAAELAYGWHEGQTRKYGGGQYIAHPAQVAHILSTVTSDDNVLCAAWLHDAIEDCGVPKATISAMFNSDVADLVMACTNPSQILPELKGMNRKKRKAYDVEHTKNASPRAKMIKMADIISNLHGITYDDPSFAKIWVSEKYHLLDMLMPAFTEDIAQRAAENKLFSTLAYALHTSTCWLRLAI